MPSKEVRQTMAFSADFPDLTQKLFQSFLSDYYFVSVTPLNASPQESPQQKRRKIIRKDGGQKLLAMQNEALKSQLELMVKVAESVTNTIIDETEETIAKQALGSLHELEIWRHQGSNAAKVKPCSCLIPAAQKALRTLVPSDHHGRCALMRGAEVTSVDAITNMKLWKQYGFKRSEMVETLEDRRQCPWVENISPEVTKLQKCFPHVRLNDAANEVLLLHGTTEDNAMCVVREGFDDRLSHRHLYGRGIYLTTDPCKAMEYCNDGPIKCILVARVILGHPFLADGPMKNSDRPPEVTHLPGIRHDSVIARPGIKNGKSGSKGRQVHWEFVVPRGDLQIYPELIVKFKLP